MRHLLCLILAWFAFASTAFAQGLVADSPNFQLRSDVAVDAPLLLSDLERFRKAVLDDLGLDDAPDREPLRLNLVDDIAVFEAVSPGGMTAAIYLDSDAGDDIVVGYSRSPGHRLSDALEPGWLRLVLRHEVVHHLIETRYPRKLPIWLGEGLAEYYSTYQADHDGRARFGQALPEQEPLSATQDWLPMRTVIENMGTYPDFRGTIDASAYRAQRIYYGQSWALAQFVIEQPDGLARIHRFVDGWSPEDGSPNADSEDSFERAFGLRYDGLEARLREAAERSSPIAAPAETPADASAVRVRSLGETEREANHLRLLLTHA
ncbi:MAG: hypothetical protein WBF53_03660, partial [Litorimonas sp.]